MLKSNVLGQFEEPATKDLKKKLRLSSFLSEGENVFFK